jgi:hypothetical protein
MSHSGQKGNDGVGTSNINNLEVFQPIVFAVERDWISRAFFVQTRPTIRSWFRHSRWRKAHKLSRLFEPSRDLHLQIGHPVILVGISLFEVC